MSVSFSDGIRILPMFEVGHNLDQWLRRLLLDPDTPPTGDNSTLTLALGDISRPRLSNGQKNSIFCLLTALLRASPHSKDMVVHVSTGGPSRRLIG